MNCRAEIREKIPYPELLAGLAEESARLAGAALNLRRVLSDPEKVEKAVTALYEGIANVNLFLSMFDLNMATVSEIMTEKQRQWEESLK